MTWKNIVPIGVLALGLGYLAGPSLAAAELAASLGRPNNGSEQSCWSETSGFITNSCGTTSTTRTWIMPTTDNDVGGTTNADVTVQSPDGIVNSASCNVFSASPTGVSFGTAQFLSSSTATQLLSTSVSSRSGASYPYAACFLNLGDRIFGYQVL